MIKAVIVEPRLHKALELVLLNFNKNLDEQWSFLIFHGNNNKEFISNIIYFFIHLIFINILQPTCFWFFKPIH